MDIQKQDKTCIDCEEGKRLGCQTFCCRLLVRLRPEEMEKTLDGSTPKGFVDKDPDGICIHMNRDSGSCNIWEKRPQTCREYECNSDFLLQVVLHNEFINIAETAKVAAKAFIPKENYIKIPLLKK
ncbi:MAG: hypothetical protein GXP19_08470 [Gammaproteobacteria bacterium]|nr:hypothetical protein [Gammaproteobacteria bacterium]